MGIHGRYDRNALQTFIHSILSGVSECSLDEPEDREIVAAVLLDMLCEYFGVS